MRYFLLALLILAVTMQTAYSQQQERSQRQEKEIDIDYENSKIDSTKFVLDTINLWRPLKNHNSISFLNITKKSVLSKKDLVSIPYFTLSDVLKQKNIGYPRSDGFPGLNNSIIFLGGLPNGIDLRFNNISQSLPLSGEALWSIFPMENIENIEILTGSQAFILGNNSNGALINLQEIQHHTYKPYTKLWYNQSIDETLAADGVFTQNFAKNFNFLFGFRSIFSPGTYENQWLESWNLRAKIRWNIDSLSNLSFSENFTNYGISQNGGINPYSSSELYNPLNALPILNHCDFRLFQHNINASYSTFLDRNKSNALTSSLSVILNDYSFRDMEGIINNPLDSNFQFVFDNTAILNNTSYELNLDFLDLKFGSDVAWNVFNNSNSIKTKNYFDFGAYGLASIKLSDLINISGGFRLFRKFDNDGYAFGARLESQFFDDLKYYFDVSTGTRLPSIIELNRAQKEIHNLFIFGLNAKFRTTTVDVVAYYRLIDNPIRFKFLFDTSSNRYITAFYNLRNKSYPGLDIIAQTQVWVLGLEAKLSLNFQKLSSFSEQDFPLFYGSVRLYYTILSGESFIKIGLSGDLLSGYKGLGYFPIYSGYYENNYKSSFMNNGLNAFAQAKLGNAYIKASLNNLLNQGFYYTPIYPEPARHFQFSFSWAFLD